MTHTNNLTVQSNPVLNTLDSESTVNTNSDFSFLAVSELLVQASDREAFRGPPCGGSPGSWGETWGRPTGGAHYRSIPAAFDGCIRAFFASFWTQINQHFG